MGVVYEAYDHERERRVALKVLQRLEPKELLRFKNEYRLMRDLRHTNLIELGELVEHEGRWFFTMELIQGIDVVRYVRRRTRGQSTGSHSEATNDAESAQRRREARRRRARFDEARLRTSFAQLARGLMALHDSGTVHRDIKPSNVLVNKDGRVVLLDFGLAIEPGRDELESKTNVAAGTSEYMAPEQAAAKPVGPEADWYSVGCVMFQTLTGRVPFAGPHLEISLRKLQHDPPAASSLIDGIAPDLDQLCLELMARNPNERATGEDILRVLAGETGDERTGREASIFVGREAEIDALYQAYEDAQDGKSVAALVRGEAGVGKSALLDKFFTNLHSSHPITLTLAGRCYEREAVPYKAVDEVIDSLVRYMSHLPEGIAADLLPQDIALAAHVFPVLRRVRAVARLRRAETEGLDWRELRSRVFAALRELLVRVAERGAVVIVIQDMQWADEDSRALLSYVFRPPGAVPCLLVMAERASPEGVASWFPQGLRELELSTLNERESRMLVTALVGEHENAAQVPTDKIVSAAGGHPLFVHELVSRALSEGKFPADPRPEALLWERIEALESRERAVLTALAFCGAPISQEVLAAATSLRFSDYSDVAEVLRDLRLVRASGVRRSDRIDVYHDRIRSTVLEKLDEEHRQQLHEALALAHESCGSTDDEALARHWFGAGEAGKARDYAVVAAEAAAEAFAFERSARLYRFALDLESDATTAASQRRLRARLGDVLANSGRAADAAEQYIQAAVGSGDVASLELRRLAAEQLLCSGHIDQGLDVLAEVLESVNMRIPTGMRGIVTKVLTHRMRLKLGGMRYRERDESQISLQELRKVDVCWSTVLGIGAVDHRLTSYFQAHHLDSALRAGEPYRLVRALVLEAFFRAAASGSKGVAHIQSLLQRIEELAGKADNAHGYALVSMARGSTAAFRCDWEEGRRSCDVAERQLRETCRGVTRELTLTRQSLYSSLAMLGEFEELTSRMPPSIRDADERGDLYAGAGLRLGAQNQLWLALDDPDLAEQQVEQAISGWSKTSYYVQNYLGLVAHVHIDLYRGDFEKAWSRLARDWDGLQKGFILKLQFARVVLSYARARAAVGIATRTESDRDRDEYLRSAAADVRRLQREKNPCASLFAKLVEAGIAAGRGTPEKAIPHLERAVALARELKMIAHEAAAERRLGELRGGKLGSSQIESAFERMKSKGILDSDRFSVFLTPGL